MRNTISIIILFLFHLNSFSQPLIQWQKCLGGTSDDSASSIEITSDGGYIISGSTYSNDGNVSGNHGYSDAWIIKLNAAGTVEWQKCFGTFYEEFTFNAIQTSDGGYIFAGYKITSGADKDAWIVKLNSLGNIIWEKDLGGTSIDEATHIEETTDGGFIISGFTASIDGDVTGQHGFYDIWVVKMTMGGIIEWQKCLGGDSLDRADYIIQTNDGGYIVAGQTTSNNGDVSGNHGGYDAWVVKLSASGVVEWQKCIGSGSTDMASTIQKTADGGYIVGVTGIYNSNFGLDFIAVKLTASGSLQWEKTFGGTGSDSLGSIIQTNDGNYIAVGYSNSNNYDVSGNHGNGDGWIIKLTSTGTLSWQKCFGGALADSFYRVKQTSDNGFIILGSSESNNGDVSGNHGEEDIWVVRLNPEILANESFTSPHVTLFPNPSKSTINLQVPSNSIIEKIMINDITGKTIMEKEQSTNQLSIEDLPSGIYLVKVFTNSGILLSKFIKE